jgi:hypothetical protein
MSIIVTDAEYDETEQALKLVKPLKGVQDHTRVQVTVHIDEVRPWLALQGSLSGEDGESFARAIDDMFPIEK